jgi:hypothetical protein
MADEQEIMYKLENIKEIRSQAPVTHACNPRYSGGRYQEDHKLKPAPEK